MSRSEPTQNNPNPSTRWISWGGADGILKYYDKSKDENVEIGSDFTFLLLDSLCAIRGWHEASESGIFSNEVRDTRSDMFVVKSFKGGILSEGFYKDIKDRVNSLGGKFTTNLYVAFKDGGELKIGTLSFQGAALSAWMDFSKTSRSDLYKKAVRINGSVDGKKGSVKFKTPKFSLVDISPETDDQATELDKVLQAYLKAYLAKPKTQQARDEYSQEQPYGDEDAPAFTPPDDDPDQIPF